MYDSFIFEKGHLLQLQLAIPEQLIVEKNRESVQEAYGHQRKETQQHSGKGLASFRSV